MANLSEGQLGHLTKAIGMLRDMAVVLDDPAAASAVSRNDLIDALHEIERLIVQTTEHHGAQV